MIEDSPDEVLLFVDSFSRWTFFAGQVPQVTNSVPGNLSVQMLPAFTMLLASPNKFFCPLKPLMTEDN